MNESKSQRGLSKDEATRYYMHNIELVRAVAARYAPARSLQEDVAHDTYIYFVENADRWERDEAKIRGLLRTIVQHMAARQWHEYVRNMPDALKKLALHLYKESEEDTLSTREDQQQKLLLLEACMGKLSQENRELVEQLYIKGESYAELTEKLNKTPSALYKMMSRIRAVLHDCLIRSLAVEVNDV